MDKIYFDYAATTPVDPEVMAVMEPFFFTHFGNASSPHAIGRFAQNALEESREKISDSIGARAEEIVFNSGATEGNNHAVFGAAQACKSKGRHIIVSSVEHHAVLEPVECLQREGFEVTYLKVSETGCVDPRDVAEAITEQTVLVAVMHASNEIGTIQPVEDIGRITRERGVLFLVDACQTVGHIPVDVDALGADLLTFSGHKFYGPKGIGGLYVRKGVNINRLLLGGDQERGRRASTQNVAGAVGMAKALELCLTKMSMEMTEQARLRNRLLDTVPKCVDGVKVNGAFENRLPNNAHFSFERVQGESLLMSLDMNHICASMGSACTSGAMEPSHVLRAIGLPDELAFGSLRLTLGRWTKDRDIDVLLETLPGLIKALRI